MSDTVEQGLRCGWAGCPVELPDEVEWIKHVAVHVFSLRPFEITPWLGRPEDDPDRDRQHGKLFRGSLSPNSILNIGTFRILQVINQAAMVTAAVTTMATTTAKPFLTKTSNLPPRPLQSKPPIPPARQLGPAYPTVVQRPNARQPPHHPPSSSIHHPHAALREVRSPVLKPLYPEFRMNRWTFRFPDGGQGRFG